MSWKRHLPINFNMQYTQYCMMTSMEDLSAQRPKRGRALCLDSRNFNCLIPQLYFIVQNRRVFRHKHLFIFQVKKRLQIILQELNSQEMPRYHLKMMIILKRYYSVLVSTVCRNHHFNAMFQRLGFRTCLFIMSTFLNCLMCVVNLLKWNSF